MKHHTKDKGDLGVLKAQVDLHEKGFAIFVPLTEHSPFDLVAYKGGDFRRIQVKYRKIKNGALTVRFRSAWADKHGTHTKLVDKESIDVYCVYCPDTNSCYYFNPSDFNETVNLRVEAPKNNQMKNVKFASDYCRVP